jgi:hypothetical protein
LREEVMNVHQHVIPITTTVVSNVSILWIQTMNHGIGHTTIHVNYQKTWSQLVTPIVLGKTSRLPTSTYLIWYNVIPPFVPYDIGLYIVYPTRTKGLDPLIFKNYTCFVPRYVYPVPE